MTFETNRTIVKHASDVIFAMSEHEFVYSWLLIVKPLGLELTVRHCQYERFNEIDSEAAIQNIMAALESGNMVSYEQPNIEIMLYTYETFVVGAARSYKVQWPMLDVDDIAQAFRIRICELHEKTYVNSALLNKEFHNIVLKMAHKPNMDTISIEKQLYKDIVKDDEKMTIADTIADMPALIEEQDKRDLETRMEVFMQVKEMLINRFGQSGFSRIMSDFNNGILTPWTRTNLCRFRDTLKNNNVTLRGLIK